jgi:hypothetical protein
LIAYVRETLESLEPIRVGQSITFTILIGYATLISYTWPHGFLPLVAIEALPVLILSFIPCVIAVWLLVSFLFYPIALASSARYWAGALNAGLAYAEDEAVRPVAQRIASQSFQRTYAEASSTSAFSITPRWVAFAVNVLPTLIVCLPAYAGWYVVSAEIAVNRLAFAVLVVPILYLSYKCFGWLVKANSVKDGIGPFAAILFTVVLLPTISFQKPKEYWFKFVPNPIVRQALEWAGLGGELPVRLTGGNSSESSDGYLIFFDGTRAWLRPCLPTLGIAIQTSTITMTYFPKDFCK